MVRRPARYVSVHKRRNVAGHRYAGSKYKRRACGDWRKVAFVTRDAWNALEIPHKGVESAYPFPVWTLVRLGVACAGIVTMLALSGCSTSDPEPDVSTSESVATMTATPSPDEEEPAGPAATPQVAGIPTAQPPLAKTPDPSTLSASALITLATVDPDAGGLLLGGYVSGIAEDGGDCQYVVSPSSGDSFTVHRDGVENNGSTSCGSTTVAPDRAPSGSYTVVLRYSTDRGEVASDPVKVNVP